MTKTAAMALMTLKITGSVALAVAPIPTEASIMSFISGIFGVEAAASNEAFDDTVNSQKMPLLEAPASSQRDSGASSTLAVEGSALVADASLPKDADFPISSHPVDNKISTYKVKAGDTITEIAEKFNISANTILWANNLKRTSTLSVGQTLVILPISGVQHKVVSGDTLLSIAKKYKGDIDEIRAYNNFDNDKLKIGDIVVIPDGELAVSTPTQSSKPKVASKPISSTSLSMNNSQAIDGYYVRPIKAGVRTQGLHGNNGVDLADSCGMPIYASAAGDVIVNDDDGGWNGGYGNYVVISHANGSQTLYSHMQQSFVSVGAHVTQGQQIGLIGATGKVKGATGCHVHFEIRSGPANPF